MSNEILVYNVVKKNILDSDPMKIFGDNNQLSEEEKESLYGVVISDVAKRIPECKTQPEVRLLLMVIFGYHFPISKVSLSFLSICGPLAVQIWDEVLPLLKK